MKNVLLWAGIAILAFQDYFKQQPVKPTRRQQFLQTGETSQAFIEGVGSNYSIIKKILTKYFGKPKAGQKSGQYIWNIKSINIQLHRTFLIIDYGDVYPDNYSFSRELLKNMFSEITENIFETLYMYEKNKDYKKLAEIAAAGDWELALEIAKGQDLL